MKHTIFTDVREQGTWSTHLSFLFELALNKMDLSPVKKLPGVDVQVMQRPDRCTTRVTISFDVVPK